MPTAHQYGGIEPLETRRLLSTGDLDPAFGGDGRVVTDIGVHERANAVAVQEEGKIVVAGSVDSISSDALVLRYNANGTLDTSFGSNGIVRLDLGADETFNEIRLSGATILVGGSIDGEGSMLVRLRGDGKFDSSFGGGDGIVLTPGTIDKFDVRNSKIVTIGGGSVRRFTVAGKLDASFGIDGTVDIASAFGLPSFNASGVTVGSDDKVIVTGSSRTAPDAEAQAFTLRLLASGAPDKGFAKTGIVSNGAPFGDARAVSSIIQPSGNIVVLYDNGFESILVRYSAGGVVDTGFSNNADNPGVHFEFRDIFKDEPGQKPAALLQLGDGRLVVAGQVEFGGEFLLTRFSADGQFDSAFSTDGRSAADLRKNAPTDTDLRFNATAAASASNESVVVVGYGVDDGDHPRQVLAIAKFLKTPPRASARVAVSNGVAVITGSTGADRISIDHYFSKLRIKLNDDQVLIPFAGLSGVRIDAGDGDDNISCGRLELTVTVNAGDGNDSVYLTDGNDSVNGGGGNDSISGYGGDDTIRGDDGNDSIDGGNGNDHLFGDADDDSLGGGTGDDLLDGGAGDDLLAGDGNYGYIDIGATSGSDPDGNDTLLGGEGDDALSGGGGTDSGVGGAGSDIVDAESVDASEVLAVKGDALRVFGRETNDSISISRNSKTGEIAIGFGQVSLEVPATGIHKIIVYGFRGDDTISVDRDSHSLSRLHINIFGGDGNDSITGGPGNDTLVGENGNDYLDGGDNSHGNDSLDGGAGNDVLYGQLGNDTLRGGRGIDQLNGGGEVGDVFPNALPGERSDIVTAPPSVDAKGVLHIAGADVDDYVSVRSATDSSDVEVYFNGLSWDFTGVKKIRCELGAGRDQFNSQTRIPATVFGGDGDDQLLGGSGNDFLNGGAGDNTIVGGAGTDTADFSDRTDDLLIHLSDQSTDEFGNPINLNSIEIVIGGSGNDRIIGTDADEALHGGRGNDTIFGLGGKDALFGDDGDDVLDGGAGPDEFHGGEGNDTADYSRRADDLVIGIDTRNKDGEAGERDNVFDDIETVRGGDGNDYISGASPKNILFGGDGIDTLVGGTAGD